LDNEITSPPSLIQSEACVCRSEWKREDEIAVSATARAQLDLAQHPQQPAGRFDAPDARRRLDLRDLASGIGLLFDAHRARVEINVAPPLPSAVRATIYR
jgi:hypothetical protein